MFRALLVAPKGKQNLLWRFYVSFNLSKKLQMSCEYCTILRAHFLHLAIKKIFLISHYFSLEYWQFSCFSYFLLLFLLFFTFLFLLCNNISRWQKKREIFLSKTRISLGFILPAYVIFNQKSAADDQWSPLRVWWKPKRSVGVRVWLKCLFRVVGAPTPTGMVDTK